MDKQSLLEELLRREEAMVSLEKYIEYCSGMKVPKHMKYVCDKLDAVARGEIKRLMISMPPRAREKLLRIALFSSLLSGEIP